MWGTTPRLIATLEVTNTSGEIILIATKGATSVASVQFGATGPGIGNQILVAAVFHIAIYYLRAAGLSTLTNVPYTPRLRNKYELMGFQNGTTLSLDDAAALEKSFTYVDDAYAKRGLNLSRAPLPL